MENQTIKKEIEVSTENISIISVCRGCLETELLNDMNDINIDDTSAMEVFEKVSNIKVDDIITPKLCPNCISHLKETYKFLKILNKTNELLCEALVSIQRLPTTSYSNYSKAKNNILKNLIDSKTANKNGCLKTFKSHDDFDEKIEPSSSEDDEIPLLEKFNINKDEAKQNLRKNIEKKGIMTRHKTKTMNKILKDNDEKFNCTKCNEIYENYQDLESHFMKKHNLESECILCKTKFSNSLNLIYHMKLKHGKLKCCRLCLISFNNFDELIAHYKSEEHNTKCIVCNELFRNRKALYEHRRKKHLNPQLLNHKFKCPECPKEFANQNNIRRHILVSHNDVRFLCDTCGQSFTTNRNLQLHILKCHKGLLVKTKNTKKNFFCETCGRELKIFHKYSIAMHKAKHNGHNYVCKRCFESFPTETLLNIHEQEKAHQLFKCYQCPSRFVLEENLKVHLKNHETPGWNKNYFVRYGKSAKYRNEKGELECTYCPKIFKDKQRFDNHMRVHTNERPYKCHICQKGFKTWIHRRTHINSHLGIKKWQCRYCPKAFTYSSTLKGHEMTHTGERPYKCEECSKGFITLSAMKKHKQVHLKTTITDSAHMWSNDNEKKIVSHEEPLDLNMFYNRYDIYTSTTN